MRSNRKSWLFIYMYNEGSTQRSRPFFSPSTSWRAGSPLARQVVCELYGAAVVSDPHSQEHCYPLADCWRPPEDGTWFSVLPSSPLSRNRSLSEHRFFVFTLCEHQLQVLKNSLLGQGLALSKHQLRQALGAGISLSMSTMFKTTVRRYFF